MTSLKQTSLFTEEQLTSLPADFLASHTVQQESDSEKKMNATCGQKCVEQFEKFNHVGLWAKTFSALLIGMEGWYSKRCKLTWKLKGTKSNRMYFQLRPLTLHTEETEFGLLPTPRTTDVEGGLVNNVQMEKGSYFRQNKNGIKWGVKLRDVVENRLIPTPRANDTNTSTPGTKSFQHRLNRDYMGEVVLNMANAEIGKTSQLSPQFVMEMMGFPTDWTLLPFLNGEQNQSKQEETQ